MNFLFCLLYFKYNLAFFAGTIFYNGYICYQVENCMFQAIESIVFFCVFYMT